MMPLWTNKQIYFLFQNGHVLVILLHHWNIYGLQHKCVEMTLIFNPWPYYDP